MWAEKNLPSRGQLGEFQQQIYFGETEPDYSIVGAPAGTPPVELNIPQIGGTSKDQNSTYDGDGRRGDRVDVPPDAVRREVLGLLDPAVRPGQLGVADDLRPRPAARW